HVGEHGDLQLALHLGEDLEALLHAGTAEAFSRAAVGLVVAALEDEGDAELGGHLLQLPRHVHLQLLALDDARARDEEERLVETYVEATEFQFALGVKAESQMNADAARMNVPQS